MSRSRSPITEALTYFRDLGFEDVRAPEVARRDQSTTAAAAPSDASERPDREDSPPERQGREDSPPERPGREDGPPELTGREDGDAVARLAALATEAGGCRACRLHEGRQEVVFGSGAHDADLLFIGEGPGAEEDRRGLPFVGRAGELLTRIIGAIGLTREEVYIANVVKCRPPKNRDPQADEVAACGHFLKGQIEAVDPKVIVALGRVAAQTLLGTDSPLGRMRGQWYQVEGVDTRVTYHPAALLRNEGLKRPTWEDMKVVRDRLAEGPSEGPQSAP